MELLGHYYFRSKTHQGEFSPEGTCKAAMFPLLVTEKLGSWPEENSRSRIWLTVPEASENCRHAWMKDALLNGFLTWHSGLRDMERYTSDRADDLVVPDDQCAESNFPSKERWQQQWGLNTLDDCDISLDNSYAFGKGDFSCETLVDVDQLEIDCLVGNGDQVEISGVRGGISESSNCWNAPLNNQDYQLDGFPWTNQTDENFLNTLLEDDLRANDQFHIYGSPKSHCTYLTENNLNSDMLLDSHDMDCNEQADSPKFPYTSCWDTEQSDASHHNLQNIITSSHPQYNAPAENTPQEVCPVKIVNENHLAEETVLQEFGSALQKMTHKTRLCFRDAMYRLATNSEEQVSVINGEHGGNYSSEKRIKTTKPYQNLRFMEKDATEHRTNTIDRTIADLLFNKPYQHGDCHQDLISAAKPHNWCPQKQLQPAFIRGR